MQFYKDTIELAKALKAKEKVRVTELLAGSFIKKQKEKQDSSNSYGSSCCHSNNLHSIHRKSFRSCDRRCVCYHVRTNVYR